MSETSESSSVEEGSSINSEDIWVNPLSATKDATSAEDYTEDSEFTPNTESEETEEYEETEEESSTDKLDKDKNKPVKVENEDCTDPEESNNPPSIKKNLTYLYQLMNEEVPEEVLRRDSIVSEEKNVEIEVYPNCPRCDKEMSKENAVKFFQCKHMYCINCVLDSHGAKGEAFFYQCPVMACSSTCSTKRIEENFPSHVASFKKYKNMCLENQFSDKNLGSSQINDKRRNSIKKQPKIESKNEISEDISTDMSKEEKTLTSENQESSLEGNKKRKLSFSKFGSSSSSVGGSSSKLKSLLPKKNSNKRLQNVLSVACPSCKIPVSADPNEDVVICDGCGHVFCFACLQTLELGSSDKHECMSSVSDNWLENSEGGMNEKKKRSLGHRVIATLIPSQVRHLLQNRQSRNQNQNQQH